MSNVHDMLSFTRMSYLVALSAVVLITMSAFMVTAGMGVISIPGAFLEINGSDLFAVLWFDWWLPVLLPFTTSAVGVRKQRLDKPIKYRIWKRLMQSSRLSSSPDSIGH